MEKKIFKTDKSFGHNNFKKMFLLSDYLEEPKVQKGWFANKFDSYVSSLKKDVDNFTREERFLRLRKKMNSFSQKKSHHFPNDIKKYSLMNSIKKGNKYYLKRHILKENINNLSNSKEKEEKTNIPLITNYNNYCDNKNKSVNINNSVDANILKQKTNKNPFNLNLDLTLLNIPVIENKNKYITKYINNISEETEELEKKLIKQEKRKYLTFKTKYNKLFNDYKKVQVDINQYVFPKKDYRYKFNLDNTSSGLNEEGFGNIKEVMSEISNRLKNRHLNKASIPEIIVEVEKFKFKEKRLRDRIKKSHDRFDYLINDSNIIQKRIDIKCRKNNEIY